jgi:hypothetical protein
MRIARLIASSSVHGGHVAGKSVGFTLPAAIALFSRWYRMSPFSQWSWQTPPSPAMRSMTWAMNSSEHMRFGRRL